MSELEFIEACYQPSSGEAEWGARLAERIGRVAAEASMVLGGSYVVDADGLRYVHITGDARFAAQPSHAEDARRCAAALNRSRSPLLAVGYGRPQPNMGVISELPGELSSPIRRNLPHLAVDSLGCFGSLDGRRGYLLAPTSSTQLRVPRRRREQLTRLSEHLATGYWLRGLRAEAAPLEAGAAAVCTPDGRVLHDSGEHPALSAGLADAVRNMDRARCRRKKRTPAEAAELWQALLAGQYTLVESTERDGRRLILAVRCRTPRPALSPREAAVAVSAARGAANKAIAAELGLATGTVGVHLAAALRKLGCPSRSALAQWLSLGRLS